MWRTDHALNTNRLLLAKLPRAVCRHPRVKRAVRLHLALQTGEFGAFLRLFQACSLLEQSLLLRHLPRVWTRALTMMNKAFGKQDTFALRELARWMALPSATDAHALCQALNLTVDGAPDAWGDDEDGDVDCGGVRFKLSPMHDELDATVAARLVDAVCHAIFTRDVAGKRTATDLVLG